MKSAPENIQLSKDLFHQFSRSTECLLSTLNPPQGAVESQQVQQHRVQAPQRQMGNVLVQARQLLLASANL